MKILVVQNKMGIGDMVIYIPFIEGIARKFNSPVYLLVKKSSKADEILKNNKLINKIIILDRKDKTGKHDGFFGSIRLIKELKNYNFDKIFIFNSSLRYNLIARLSNIKEINQYPLFQKKNQHIVETAIEFLKTKINSNISNDPVLDLDSESINYVKKKYNINKNQKNIILGIGGSGPTKQISSKIYIKLLELICNKYPSRFFLATGKSESEQIILSDILRSRFVDKSVRLDKLTINEILPIIKNCDVSICNDSSFSHLSAALSIPTLVLMADTPLIYGSYNSFMTPIIPKGEKSVIHGTLGKNKIDPFEIFSKFEKIIN